MTHEKKPLVILFIVLFYCNPVKVGRVGESSLIQLQFFSFNFSGALSIGNYKKEPNIEFKMLRYYMEDLDDRLGC